MNAQTGGAETMTEQGHNGWSNYETWCVNLWLSNEEALYRDILELAADAIENEPETTIGLADIEIHTRRNTLADQIKNYVEELEPAATVLEGASFVSDLLSSALSEVDFREIAQHWLEDAEELAEHESR